MQADAARHEARVADLSPACFAMVMATGIVSVAARQHGWHAIAGALFVLNIAAWLAFLVLTLWRAVRYPRRLFADLDDHQRGPAFFTAVAGTAVLGGQCALFGTGDGAALALGIIAALAWLALTYSVFPLLVVKEHKPTLQQGVSGTWLLAVVATQSLAVLGAMLAPRLAAPWPLEFDFFALAMWLCGGMLYMWMISLIFYRSMFLRFAPDDLTPPYWIDMGAMAISTLAGSLLIANAPREPLLAAMVPFLQGFTVLYWATGTWWIPLLLVLTVWRYFVRRSALRYDPLYWGAVFPLGMYSAATYEMARTLQLPFLAGVTDVFLLAALASWIVAFAGMLRMLLELARPA